MDDRSRCLTPSPRTILPSEQQERTDTRRALLPSGVRAFAPSCGDHSWDQANIPRLAASRACMSALPWPTALPTDSNT